MNKKKLYWLFQIGGWGCYFVLFIIANIFDQPAGESINYKAFIAVIFEVLMLMGVSHFFRFVIVRESWLLKPIPRLIPRILSMLIIFSIPIYPIKLAFSSLLGLYSPSMWDQMVFSTTSYVVFFFLWIVFYFLYHYFYTYNRSLKLETAMKEMELANLKSQMNPHFIFNALNSIRALVDENPSKSKMAINQLSNILRKSLSSDNTRLTNFEDEFRTVKDYLALESTRFEERLKTEFDIHPESFDYPVPPLMLQTLVENGIKHGISNLKKGGKIQLRTFVEDGIMHIHIRNTGQYLNGKNTGSIRGLGIKNTKQRLKLIYGNAAHFKIFNENSQTVLTIVKIPKIETL